MKLRVHRSLLDNAEFVALATEHGYTLEVYEPLPTGSLTGASEMAIRNRMGAMAVALASAFGVLGEAGRSAGESVMRFMANTPGPASFGQRYGGNPRSTGNGGQGRGNVARMKRAARTRRNIAARSSKRRHG